MRESYRFYLEKVSMYDEENILLSLPQDLRESIAMNYAKKIFHQPDNGLFGAAHPQFVAKVLPMLRPGKRMTIFVYCVSSSCFCFLLVQSNTNQFAALFFGLTMFTSLYRLLKTVLFQPHSIILLQDDIAESMFIITKGILDVEVGIVLGAKENKNVDLNEAQDFGSLKTMKEQEVVKEDKKGGSRWEGGSTSGNGGDGGNDSFYSTVNDNNTPVLPGQKRGRPTGFIKPLPGLSHIPSSHNIKQKNSTQIPSVLSRVKTNIQSASLSTKNKKIATLLAGEIFGAMAILR